MELEMGARRTIRSRLAAAVRSLVRRSDPSHYGVLSDWTDAELYKVWCATAAELLKAQSEHTAAAVAARQYLLAEIECRHPRATAAWLSSDRLLYGEPPRFLLHDT
ncbi:hypothetical protein [Kribbella sp.]|uniref:hypothetical protein n=1 Tax=Kribbella sp. TaxID=1871183 RepID=UPI002D576D5A|nr:hypothetical protein [Kribbella sp.]HZX07897.1 hypothetical protein [Kribbella sp.]